MMTSFQLTSGTARSGYVYCLCIYYVCVYVCACVHNSHTDSRPVEHQPSSFIMIYIVYTDPNISSPSSVRFPTGANICSPISKRDHDPRPNTPSPHRSVYPALLSSSSQVDDLKQTMRKPRRCSRYIIYTYICAIIMPVV